MRATSSWEGNQESWCLAPFGKYIPQGKTPKEGTEAARGGAVCAPGASADPSCVSVGAAARLQSAKP